MARNVKHLAGWHVGGPLRPLGLPNQRLIQQNNPLHTSLCQFLLFGFDLSKYFYFPVVRRDCCCSEFENMTFCSERKPDSTSSSNIIENTPCPHPYLYKTIRPTLNAFFDIRLARIYTLFAAHARVGGFGSTKAPRGGVEVMHQTLAQSLMRRVLIHQKPLV